MSVDSAFGADQIGVHAASAIGDLARETGLLVVSKYDLDQTRWARRKLGLKPGQDITAPMFDRLKIMPGEVAVCPGNLLLQTGWNQLLNCGWLGSAQSTMSATVGRIGIGSGTTAATSADTALGSVTGMSGAGSNWKLLSGAPVVTTTGSPSTGVFTASFGTTDALGTWNEWGIDHGTSNSTAGTATATPVVVFINHAVPGAGGPGTKGAATWTATATLSFT